MKRVIVYVDKQLVDRNALLLPSVHDLLFQYIIEVLRAHNLGSENITKLVTFRWVLSTLKATLQNHMNIVYTCTVHEYGTSIYRPNTDLQPALDQAP